MLTRARQKISTKVARALDGLARGVQDWAADHLHAPEGDVAGEREGLLERHGVDLRHDAADLDRQFDDHSRGYLVRRYAGGLQASESGEVHTDQISTSGVEFHDDLPKSEDDNATFQPVKVRGRSTSKGHGLYHQMWLTSSAYQRAWGTPLQGMVTGEWSVEPPKLEGADDKVMEAAQKRARTIERALIDNIQGGWHKTVTEWLYALVAGFAPFETVYHGTGPNAGLVERLAFIYPSAVDGWLLDEHGQDLEGVRFERADDGGSYVIEAEDLQLYSHLQLGSNFEGVSPLRSVTRWIQTVQLLQQLENLAKERLGVPWITASYEDPLSQGGSDSTDDKLMEILQDARAEESPAIRLPNGASMELHSAAGNEPDFEKPKQFAIKQIKQRLNAEGSLIAVNDTGAFAAREEAAKDAIQIAGYLAHLMAQNFNGSTRKPHTGVIRKMEHARWGGPIQPGRYCQLKWSRGEVRDPQRAEKIMQGVSSGTITHDPAVEGEVRQDLDIALTARQQRAVEEGPDAVKEQGDAASAGPERLAAAEDGDSRQLELDLDTDKAAAKMDRLEAQLANELRPVAVEFRDKWRERIRPLIRQVREGDSRLRSQGEDRGVLATLQQRADEMERQYQRKAQERVQEVLEKARQTGAKDLLRTGGARVPQTTNLNLPQSDLDLRLEARALSREAVNRQRGRLYERTLELARGDDAISLPVLEESTFEGMANKSVSGAYNSGRDGVVKEAKRISKRRGREPELIAERVSVLDEDTCDPCEKLDGKRFLVGSKNYEAHKPPLKCRGKGRCRCIFNYIMPDEVGFDELVEELKS